MAGIGFEMKKLFVSDKLMKKVCAVMVSSAATVAPMLFTVVIVLTLQEFMILRHTAYESREKFMLIVYYAMAFSFLISSVICQPLTRYVSDRIFEHDYERILPSFYGGALSYYIIGLPFAIIFIVVSKLSILLELLGISLFFSIGTVWIQMLYLSSIRKYTHIVFGFCASTVVSLASAILINLLGIDIVAASLLGAQAGFIMMGIFFIGIIQNNFPSRGTKFFEYLTAIIDYPQLVFIGFLLALGAFLHCFILWTQPEAVVVGGLRYIPIYDVASFMAYLTLIPMYIRFNVVSEVYFAEKYQAYYSLITNKGKYTDIKLAHKEMTTVLWREIGRLIEIQLFIALATISLGLVVIPNSIIAPSSTSLFRILVLAYFAYGIMHSVTILLLYFDDRKGTLWILAAFNLLTAVFTVALLPYGLPFYGVGFFAAAIISAILAVLRLNRYVNYLEYFTFCSQPLYQGQAGAVVKFFHGLIKKINRG